VYRWEFRQGQAGPYRGRDRPLIVDDVEIMVRAEIDGVGLAFMSEERAAPAPREWGTRACARGLVPAVPRLFLYPTSTAATSGLARDRNPL